MDSTIELNDIENLGETKNYDQIDEAGDTTSEEPTISSGKLCSVCLELLLGMSKVGALC